ncbi:MAG: DUF2817 domain-containing protein [Planctomycetota bacterium]
MYIRVRVGLVVLAAAAALVVVGCNAAANGPVIVGPPVSLQSELSLQRHVVGRSVEGRPIGCLVLGDGADVTFILATMHGDEPAGTLLMHRLAAYLQQNPRFLEQRKVVLLPIANPDGMARKTRHNANGVDLNRNFAAENRINSSQHGSTPLCEPEAAIIEQLIRQYRPDRIVSIHQVMDTGPQGLARRFPNGCIDYDGPAKELADRMAERCDLTVAKLGAAAGSLGSYAGVELQIPVITMELPKEAHRLDVELLSQKYGPALVTSVLYPDLAQ